MRLECTKTNNVINIIYRRNRKIKGQKKRNLNGHNIKALFDPQNNFSLIPAITSPPKKISRSQLDNPIQGTFIVHIKNSGMGIVIF
jgi:hypothetical protein